LRERERSYLGIGRTVSQLIEVIGSDLHHLDPLAPELRGVHVGALNVILQQKN
jgi:hypothetical protein